MSSIIHSGRFIQKAITHNVPGVNDVRRRRMCRSRDSLRINKPYVCKWQALFNGDKGEGQAKPQAERSVYAMLYAVPSRTMSK
mgnify:CR=1 FL=1